MTAPAAARRTDADHLISWRCETCWQIVLVMLFLAAVFVAHAGGLL